MLMLKSSSQIKASGNIKSFHSCQTSTGLSMSHVDLQRLHQQSLVLSNRVFRFFWLVQLWEGHKERCRLHKMDNYRKAHVKGY
jgi:hypothetical protein